VIDMTRHQIDNTERRFRGLAKQIGIVKGQIKSLEKKENWRFFFGIGLGVILSLIFQWLLSFLQEFL